MKTLSDPVQSIIILEFEQKYALDFARLNYEWVEEFFEVEAHDREQLDDPYSSIIAPGGHIFLAKRNHEIVGTVALISDGENTFELAKMAVSSKYRGQKIGHHLMQHVIDFVSRTKVSRIYLDSNSRLTPALNLYTKFGFKPIESPSCTAYKRCDVRMELLFS